jgi:hypothetical protein
MLAIDGSFLDFKQLDLLALRQTPVHRLDPRAKVLTTLCFIVCVVSFDRYQISAMLPFMIYPAVLMAVGDLPFGYILRKIIIVIPFALLIGLFNPVFDRQVLMQIGSLDIWGGWISCFSILIRAILTASAAIILVAITGFPAICEALEKLKMPQTFAVFSTAIFSSLQTKESVPQGPVNYAPSVTGASASGTSVLLSVTCCCAPGNVLNVFIWRCWPVVLPVKSTLPAGQVISDVRKCASWQVGSHFSFCYAFSMPRNFSAASSQEPCHESPYCPRQESAAHLP